MKSSLDNVTGRGVLYLDNNISGHLMVERGDKPDSISSLRPLCVNLGLSLGLGLLLSRRGHCKESVVQQLRALAAEPNDLGEVLLCSLLLCDVRQVTQAFCASGSNGDLSRCYLIWML